ncbi:MAG: lamin tail domain-containing protein [Saprospiraceae bacterium]|nr:lamin tail domain-containing protein [Saprospiraceae bacterium]
MKKIYLFAILFILALNAHSQIVISEIMYNPPESNIDSLEYIELQNVGSQPIQLQGWTFAQGINFTFADFTLGVGEYVVIAVKLSAFQSVFGNSATVFQMEMSSALNNGGEPISLADPQGTVVSSVTYSNAAGGWYAEADGNGASLELCDPANPINDVDNWGPSTNNTGITHAGKAVFASPGSANTSVCVSVPDVTVMVGDFFFTPADITINVGETVLWMNTGGTHNVNGTQATFPSNPESFTSGNPASGNWTLEHTFEIAGVYNYRCDFHSGLMQGTVTVMSDVVDIPTYTIGQIRGINSEGVADSLGVEAYVEGIIYGVNQRETGLQYTMINDQGDGIGLFSTNTALLSPEEGDLVKVRGVVEQFRGLLQLNISEIEILGSGNTLLDPILIDELNEQTESRLVQLVSLTIVDPSQWTNAPGGFNVTVTNGTDNFTMRIARNVNTGFTEAPVGTFDLVGIGGQFSTNSNVPPYNDGYQILPRYAADFDLMTNVQDLVFDSQVSVYPTPTNDRIYIASQIPLQRVELYNIFGVLIEFKDMSSQQNQWLEVNKYPAGTYLLQIIGAENQMITKKVVIQK